MSFYVAPSQQRTLRACMVCSLVQLHSVRPAEQLLPTYIPQKKYLN